MNGNGTIRVSTSVAGEDVVCSVSDNGCGMSSQFNTTIALPSFPEHKEKRAWE